MDKTVDIKVRAHIDPVVNNSRIQINPEELFDIPRNSGQGGMGKIPSPQTQARDLSIDSEFKKIKERAENAFRQYVSEANKYTISGRETERYVKEKTGRDYAASEQDYNKRMIETSQRLREGKITPKEAEEERRLARDQFNEDKTHTRIIKEILETLKSTSKDEIRENAKVVQENLGRSSTVGVLGAKGDEYQILKERFQKEELGEEKVLRKFNLGRYTNLAMGAGGAIAGGDIGGLAAMGGRGLMGAIGSAGAVGGAAMFGGALGLGAIAAMFAANKQLPEQMRSFMLSTQTGVGSMKGNINNFSKADFYDMGMSIPEGMDFYANLKRSSGGRDFSLRETRGYAGLTRSREVSPELLNTIISNQRYSTGGDAMGVATTLERSLKDIFGGEFKKKLVQLPEMMTVYNSLAQQMIQTTGKIDSNALARFVGGIREGFGVEGQNLQRFAGGLMGGMKGSQNPYLKKFQFAALRKAHPDYNYQQYLEILENPTSDVEYMRNYAGMMKGQGLRQFSSWFSTMNLGAKEARQAFESNDFDTAISKMTEINKNKTSPKEEFDKYTGAAKDFYSLAEKQSAQIASSFKEFQGWLSEKWEDLSVEKGIGKVIQANHGAIPVSDSNKFR